MRQKRNMITVQGAKDRKGTIKRLISLLKNYKVGIIIVLILGIVVSVLQVLSPFILGHATDVLIDSIKSGIDMNAMVNIIIALLISYGSAVLFGYIQNILLVNISQKFIYDLRKKVQNKLKFLPLSYFDRSSTGDMLSIVTNDVDTVANSLQNSLPDIFSALLTLVTVFIGMVTLSWRLTLVGLVTLPLSALFSLLLVKVAQKYFRGQQEGLGKVGGYVEEMFTNHEIIRAFNREEKVTEDFEVINDELYKNARKAQFASGMAFPLSAFFSNIGYVAVVFFGGIQVATNPGLLTLGNLQTFIQLLKQFTQPIARLSTMLNDLQATVAAAERVFEFLDEAQEPADKVQTQVIVNPHGSVLLEHVEFGYSKDKILIRDLNLKVDSGDKVAIVGPTGAGKTTLVNLLLRFYDIDSGRIMIDGIDITDMLRKDLRHLFGMVLQDTWLFNGTVMENIRYGKLDATDEEVMAAAKSAYVHEFITTQPESYNMVIDEDSTNISSGQRQLITIARAILSEPKILILDEATSSVDTRTELMIQKAMENLMEDRTSFVIAHRLSTIRDAKTIIVMDSGDIVESGNHEELLKRNGKYAELYRNQLAGIDEDAV